MKVYTKTGDKGKTALIGGKRVAKYHDRIEAYGTIDELTAYIGLIIDSGISDEFKTQLITIQEHLMIIAAVLATDCDDCDYDLPEISQENILHIEQNIDKIDETLPVLSSFILPGGHIIASHCHVARTICRRGERIIIKLSEVHKVPENVLKYINRLSDYLFVLARKVLIDNNLKEIYWKPVK